MDIAIGIASLELENLVRRAELGEDVILTRNGEPVARLEPVSPKSEWKSLTPQQRKARLDAVLSALPKFPNDGVSAARSQDFLYDEFGLPK